LPGLNGATGATGEIGPTGATGAISAASVITSAVMSIDANSAISGLVAQCPLGMQILGGGFVVNNTQDVILTSSIPDLTLNGWSISAYNTSSAPLPVQSYAMCIPGGPATPPPVVPAPQITPAPERPSPINSACP
jgi:hypothetical protein